MESNGSCPLRVRKSEERVQTHRINEVDALVCGIPKLLMGIGLCVLASKGHRPQAADWQQVEESEEDKSMNS